MPVRNGLATKNGNGQYGMNSNVTVVNCSEHPDAQCDIPSATETPVWAMGYPSF